MRAEITNFRAISGTIDLDLTGICLLVGQNEAGKTSTSQAVAAALTGQTLPDGRPKKEAKGLLHNGCEQASVVVVDGPSAVRVIWPDGKAYSEGPPLTTSIYAAGLATLPELSPREQSRVLMEYLQAVPTYEDLAAALGPQEDQDGVVVEEGLPQEVIDRAWQAVQQRDWDDAAKVVYRQHAQTLKGRWQEVTGEGKYGSVKGREWRPDLWDRSIAQSSEETLQKAVDEARDREVHAHAAVTIEDSRRQELREQMERIPELEQALADAETEGKAAGEKLQQAQDALRKLPSAEDTSVTCPHCDGALRIERGTVVAATALSEDEIEQRRQALDEARKAVSDAQEARDAAAAKYREAQRTLDEARQAEQRLSELDTEARQESGVDPEEARRAREDAEARLSAWRSHHRAQSLHAEILQSERIARVLEPDGIRKDKLAQALDRINERLTALSEAAGWKRVHINHEMNIYYGGWNYRDLSASAAFRVRVILQVAMAEIDGSAAVVIDGADILQRGARSGLIRMLHDCWQRPALVTMTADTSRPDRDPVPDLAEAGLGVTTYLKED